MTGVAEVSEVVATVERFLTEGGRGGALPASTTLLRAATPIGRLLLGEGIAGPAVDETLRRMEARRAILVSEPGAWAAVGERLAAGTRGGRAGPWRP